MQFIVVACRCAIWPLQKKLNWICFAAIWKNILDCCSINHYIFVSITFVIHVKMNCSDVERKLSQILSLFSIGNLMNLSFCVYFHLLIKIKSNYKLKSNWLVVNSTKCIHFIEQDHIGNHYTISHNHSYRSAIIKTDLKIASRIDILLLGNRSLAFGSLPFPFPLFAVSLSCSSAK